jgi:hypothetical protein
VKVKKVASVVFCGILLIAAGLAWVSYLEHGIAYGDLVGVGGREKDLAEIGRGAMEALSIAGCCEALAIGLLTWLLSDPSTPASVRFVKGLAFAVFANALTYAFVRGI